MHPPTRLKRADKVALVISATPLVFLITYSVIDGPIGYSEVALVVVFSALSIFLIAGSSFAKWSFLTIAMLFGFSQLWISLQWTDHVSMVTLSVAGLGVSVLVSAVWLMRSKSLQAYLAARFVTRSDRLKSALFFLRILAFIFVGFVVLVDLDRLL